MLGCEILVGHEKNTLHLGGGRRGEEGGTWLEMLINDYDHLVGNVINDYDHLVGNVNCPPLFAKAWGH